MRIVKKKCKKCKRVKPLDSFSPQPYGDGRRAKCRECNNLENRIRRLNPSVRKRENTYAKQRYQNCIVSLKEQHGARCVHCGYSGCLSALHFHHVNPLTKIAPVSDMIASGTIQKAIEEARKCVLLCANCHAELEAGLWDLEAIESATPATVEPGSASANESQP